MKKLPTIAFALSALASLSACNRYESDASFKREMEKQMAEAGYAAMTEGLQENYGEIVVPVVFTTESGSVMSGETRFNLNVSTGTAQLNENGQRVGAEPEKCSSVNVTPYAGAMQVSDGALSRRAYNGTPIEPVEILHCLGSRDMSITLLLKASERRIYEQYAAKTISAPQSTVHPALRP